MRKILWNKVYKAAGVMLLTGMLAGCSKDSSEALEYRSEGIGLYDAGDYENAAVAFEKALEEKTGNEMTKDLQCYIASSWMHLQDYESALQVYEEIDDYEKDSDIMYLRGLALLTLERKSEAYESFEAAIAADDKNYELYLDVYLQMDAHGDAADGALYLQQILDKVSGSKEDAYLQRGRAYYYLNETDKAKEELKKAEEKGSSRAAVYLGMTEEDGGNYEAALGIYQAYRKQNEADADLYNRIAACKLNLGDVSALEEIEAGLALDERSVRPELLYHEVVAYELKGEYQTAAEKAEAYLQLYPDDEAMHKEYTFLKTR